MGIDRFEAYQCKGVLVCTDNDVGAYEEMTRDEIQSLTKQLATKDERIQSLEDDKKRLQYFESHALNLLSLESGKEIRAKMIDYDASLKGESHE